MLYASTSSSINHLSNGGTTISFSIKSKDVRRILGIVVSIHACIFLLAMFGLPSFKVTQKPDITIEIGAAPPASSGPANMAKSTPPAAPKKPPKEPMQPLVQDPASSVTKSQPQTTSSPAAVANSSGGPVSAPTVDADYKAAYLQNPKPPYPPLAFRLRAEGKVILLAEVLPDGRAGKVNVSQSSGHELLDQSALETVKKWKFTPARKDGVIVTQAVRIPIIFSLKNR
jgi:protein TonB